MEKMIDTLDRHLIAAIKDEADLSSIRAILLKYKNSGIPSEHIGELLSEFLEQVRESVLLVELEDKVLEVLDIVTGFCSPSLKVWDN